MCLFLTRSGDVGVKEFREEMKRQDAEFEKRKWERYREAVLTKGTEKISEYETYVVDFCNAFPVCGPYGKVAEVIASTAEFIDIVATAYYEGLGASGGKAARKTFNTVVEKKLVSAFEKRHLPKPLAERLAHFFGRAFDQTFGDMVENGTKCIIGYVPLGPQLPPGTP